MLEFLPLLAIALLFWLFIIRPTSRRQKELARMQSSLVVGDEIVLTSGVYGTVQRVEDDHLLLEVSPGVSIKVARGAVGTIANKVDEPAGEPPVTDGQTGTVAGPEEN